MGVCVVIGIIATLLYYKNKRNEVDIILHGIVLRHSVIFLVGFFIVFYQYAIDYVIGLIDADNKILELVWINSAVVNKATALSTMALVSFIIGYISFPSKGESCHNNYTFANPIILSGFCYFILAIYLIKSGIGADPDLDPNRGLLVIFQAFYIAYLSIFCYQSKKEVHHPKQWFKRFKPLIILSIIYVLIVLLTGKRTAVLKILFLLLVAYCYILPYKRLSWIKIATGIFIGMAIMAIVGVSRGGVMSISDAIELIKDYPSFSPATMELAGSINTVHVALTVVPSEVDYNWGSSFFEGFTVLIPGLSQLKAHLFQTMGSEDFITQQYFGGNVPTWGWGFGSSAIADAYISFGPVGVCLLFAIFGLFIKYIETGTFVNRKSPFFLVLSFCIYSQMLSFMRGPFSLLFLSWSYAFLLVYILYKLKKVKV